MSNSKVQLSGEELSLLKNSEWILTKNRALYKLGEGLGGIASWMQSEFTFPFETGSPKISRGERYAGLPYLILDYPRVFSKQNVCAIRTFIWWGKHASVILHVKGSFLEDFLLQLSARTHEFAEFRYALDGDEWIHDLTDPAYKDFANADFKDPMFLKLGVVIKLDQWETMAGEIQTAIRHLSKLI